MSTPEQDDNYEVIEFDEELDFDEQSDFDSSDFAELSFDLDDFDEEDEEDED